MPEQEETQAQQAEEEVQEEEVSLLDQLLSKIDTAAPAILALNNEPHSLFSASTVSKNINYLFQSRNPLKNKAV